MEKKTWLKTVPVFLAVIVSFGVYQVFYLKKAHSTFDDYYKFRDCQSLISKSADSGICKLKDGATIKIVNYQGKWYLDGDLPCGFLCF